ncbi:MAG TPA: DNA recombination protein RmuC [Galbitalea sp.]
MDPVVALIIGLAVGLVLGVLVGWLISRTRGRGATDTNALSTLQSQAAGAAATAAALRDQVDQLLQQQKLNQAKSDEDNRILQVLTPVQEALRTMQTQVGELERERTTQFGAISQQLLSARQSEEQLRATAESLASALRSNSVRGVWGETQLRRVVEAAGLIDHVDFIEQASVQSDVGRGRIDMVVQLSDRKSLAVDSKVPFDSYLLAQQIPLTATGEEAERRARYMTEHVRALRGHIDALSKKEYWEGLADSPDLVIAFIPSESLLSSALEFDPGLLDYAFRKNVAVASPVTLWAVLKTVAYSWRQESLTADAKKLFDLGKELYKRVSTLAEYSESLRRSIEATVNNYNKFSASLETRVLVTARKLNDAGDPTIQIAESRGIDETPKALTAPELLAEVAEP